MAISKIFYGSLMVTTKQKSTVDSKKIKRRESKKTIAENHQFTKQKERKKGTREQQNSEKTIRCISESLPINNYFKCKWIEFSNQKT